MRNTAIVIPTVMPATAFADVVRPSLGLVGLSLRISLPLNLGIGIDAIAWVITAEQSVSLMEPRKIAFSSRMNAVGSAAGGLYTGYGVGNKIGDLIPRLQ